MLYDAFATKSDSEKKRIIFQKNFVPHIDELEK